MAFNKAKETQKNQAQFDKYIKPKSVQKPVLEAIPETMVTVRDDTPMTIEILKKAIIHEKSKIIDYISIASTSSKITPVKPNPTRQVIPVNYAEKTLTSGQ